ncbi:Uncharacterised protein [Mycobacteroides abscessus subsp. abscessus]|nr:Uncharacterised protein [Mycobacteroides abscessus subsp. abscessus]
MPRTRTPIEAAHAHHGIAPGVATAIAATTMRPRAPMIVARKKMICRALATAHHPGVRRSISTAVTAESRVSASWFVLARSASAAAVCHGRGSVETDSVMRSWAMRRTCELCVLLVAGTEARMSSSRVRPCFAPSGSGALRCIHASSGYPVRR